MDQHESDEVVDVASQVADGVPVDWPSARDGVAERSRAAVEQLRAIAEIARVHRSLAGAAGQTPQPAPDGGTPWGPLVVFERLGSGGFGEVFRAWDASLQREVALKLLRSHAGATDAAVEEGQRLARVSHPNVMAVYGAQRVGTKVGIWSELLRGRTLAAVIDELGPMSADETLIAGEAIAGALAAVHRGGMLHRDVKAQNVFREKGGRLVLMDFGLGRELDGAAPGDLSGTPVYLAPELFASGSPSPQSDIYSLGVLLFFLVTGGFPVTGGSLEDIKHAHREGRRARLQDLRPELPRQFVQVVERALDPDPAKRYESAGAMQTALARAVHGDDARLVGDGRRQVAPLTVVLACAAVGLATAALVWIARRPAPPPPRQTARFVSVPPAAQSLDVHNNDRNVAISPDGRFLVYRSGGTSAGGPLMLRQFDRFDAQPLPGITNGRTAFFSADSRAVGFFEGQEIKRIALTGEPAVTVCRFDVPGGGDQFPRGASWGDDNTIVFATTHEASGLWRVPAAGGTPVKLTTPDPARHEIDHLFPSVLPGNRGVLFTISRREEESTMEIAVLDSRTGAYETVISRGSQPEYIPSGSAGPGFLLYAVGGRLRVVGFDLERLKVVGTSEAIVEHLQMAENGGANYAISQSGTLAYLAGEQEPPRALVWVTRDGREERIDAPDRTYAAPRLSPDGRRIVVEVRQQEQDLWTWDPDEKRLKGLTFGGAFERSPEWGTDGRVVYSSAPEQKGPFTVYTQPADGNGTTQQLTAAINAHPTSIGLDGTIIGNQFVGSLARIFRLRPGAHVEPLLDLGVDHRGGQFSPNGRYIAYQSNEGGGHEVFVRPYPDVKSRRWLVSSGGGSNPLWARNGTELFFLDGASVMTAVPVNTTSGQFTFGDARRLFDGRSYVSDATRSYDVSLDGSKFLLIKQTRTVESSVTTPAIFLVLNWTEEIRSKLRPGR